MWKYTVKIRHLLQNGEDHKSIQDSMNAIADALSREPSFSSFDLSKFRTIPIGDDVFGPVDYAKKLLDRMYDFADANRIWIE